MRRPIAVAATAFLLAGCAGETAFREGMKLIDEGQYEQGIGRLEDAAREDPSDNRFRIALLNNRTIAANRLAAEGATAEGQGRYKEAEALYRRALAIHSSNQQAADGLRTLEKLDVHNEVVKQAQALVAKKDYEQAVTLAQGVLAVNPRHKGALALMSQIEQARAKEALALPQLKSRFTKPVTLEFRDANLKMVFDVIARTSGINFVFDKDVKGDTKVTIYVRNVAVEDAIDLLLIQSQLEKKVLSDNSMLIYPNTPQKQKEYQDLVIRSFYLGNGDAKQTLNLIKTIIKTKDVYVDERLNLLVMRDTLEAVRLAEKLIFSQDMAEPEVLLEMEVLEINRRKTYDMGITWPSTFTVLPSGSVLLSDLPFGPGHTLDSSDIQINTNLIARLRQDNSLSNLISNPRIRVKNREKARVLVGSREPVVSSQVTPGSTNPIVTETIQYLDVGLKLDIEPTVLLDDEVALKVGLEVSNVTARDKTTQGTSLITVGTRNVNTSLRLKDGETAIMLGFMRDDATDNRGGIPGLTDIPVISRLFSTGTADYTKNEIVFSITPRVIRNVRRPDMQMAEFWSGTEASLRTKPPILQSAPAAAAAYPAAAPQRPSQPGVTPATPGAPAQPPAAPAQPGAAPAQPGAAAPAPEAHAALAPDAAPQPPEVPALSGQPLKLSWSAPAQAKVGSEVKVSLVGNSPDPLLGAGVVLKYDPATLQAVKVEEGAFLKQAGAETTFSESITPNVGRVVANVRRNAEPGVKGEGPLLTITFKVLAPGASSQVHLLSVSPIAAGGGAMRFQASGPLTLSLIP